MPEGDRLAAYCAHILPIRSALAAGTPFLAHLRAIRGEVLDAFENQDVPFASYVGELSIARSPSRAPLADYIFNLDGKLPTPVFEGLSTNYYDLPVTHARFELGFNAVEIDEKLVFYCDYNSDLFDGETMNRLLRSFQVLLQSIVVIPEGAVDALPIMTEEQRQQVLAKSADSAGEWSASRSRPTRHAGIHQYLEEHARATPEAIAVTLPAADGQGPVSLSYGQLDRRANRLAHCLRRRRIGPETVVGICLERTPDMIVAVLGALKAGAAYLPLDPNYPAERIAFILRDAGASLLLSQSALRGTLPEMEADVLCLDQLAAELESMPESGVDGEISGQQLAYVIYTSGSTGRPKGAEVTHYNVARLFEATHRLFEFSARDVWTLFHSLAFDFSVWELWGALAYGGRLVIVPFAISRSPAEFCRLLGAEGVTVLNQTPSAFGQLVQHDATLTAAADLPLRLVIFGGEALHPRGLGPWIARHGDRQPKLVNMSRHHRNDGPCDLAGDPGRGRGGRTKPHWAGAAAGFGGVHPG